MNAVTNLQVQRRSNRPPRAGDIFAMSLPSGKFLFGRVVLANLPADRAPMPTANLIYIYKVITDTKEPPLDELLPQRLLIPPEFINRMPWTKGYFETVWQGPIGLSDRLAQHCFYDVARRVYCDEAGDPIDRKVEPCGRWGLASYRKVDDLISDALGLQRAPADQ